MRGSDTSEYIHSESFTGNLVYITHIDIALLTWISIGAELRFSWLHGIAIFVSLLHMQWFISIWYNAIKGRQITFTLQIYMFCSCTCGNLLELRKQINVCTNRVFFVPMLQLNCLSILPLHHCPPRQCPRWVQQGNGSFYVLGSHRGVTVHVHMCILTRGLEEGLLDTVVGPTQ